MGKKEIIFFIKNQINNVTALQSGFRIDKKNKFIKINSYSSGVYIYDEYITMLDKNDVLIQTYCDGDKLNPTDIKPYKLKYEHINLDCLLLIQSSLFCGNHIEAEINI